MYSEFTKEFKIEDKTEEEKCEELVEEIKKVKKNLENIYNNLHYADSDLIDFYTYQIILMQILFQETSNQWHLK